VLDDLDAELRGVQPTFEGGDAFAARAEEWLPKAREAASLVVTSLQESDPANTDDNAMRVLGASLGFIGVALPLGFILTDPTPFRDSGADVDANDMLAQTPGSLAFYAETRDEPGCDWMFEDPLDRTRLDAMVDGSVPAGPTS
jgi:hypothetical protein